jgi:hypothetical protein
MPKQANERALGFGESYEFSRYLYRLPAGHTLEDLFVPTYWTQITMLGGKLRPLDIIRVRSEDGSIDCEITVTSVMKGAAIISLYPRLPADVDRSLSKPRELAVVPVDFNGRPKVRIEEDQLAQAGKRFRLLAINGSELSRHASRPEADGAMAAYLAQLHMRLPTEAECEEAVAKQQANEDRVAANVAAARKRARAGAGE